MKVHAMIPATQSIPHTPAGSLYILYLGVWVKSKHILMAKMQIFVVGWISIGNGSYQWRKTMPRHVCMLLGGKYHRPKGTPDKCAELIYVKITKTTHVRDELKVEKGEVVTELWAWQICAVYELFKLINIRNIVLHYIFVFINHLWAVYLV